MNLRVPRLFLDSLPLVRQLARQELVDRHKGSVLGTAWTIIGPLVTILVFVLVFSRIMGARLEGFGAEIEQYTYSIYLIAGILPWMVFAKSLERITNLFVSQGHLITKVRLSLKALPLSVLLAEGITHLIGMALFAIFLLLIGYPFSLWWLGLPLVYALQSTFLYGLGLTLAILAVYLKDIREMVAVSLQLWFWVTPIVYVTDILPPWVVGWLSLNPMFHIVGAYRDLIMRQQMPALAGLVGLLVATLALVALAFWLLARTERDLRDSF